nr:hypothetical protein [uncultured archaeon]
MSLSSQAVATTRQLTPVEIYAIQVIGDDSREAELWRALPSHIRPDRFKRNLVNLLMQRPEMLRYDPRFVYREVSKAAALGLLLDPQLGEAYVVPVWNAKAKREEPQLRVGYRGLIKLARQSGEIKKIYAHEVCANDHVECELGLDKRLVHRPDLYGDRGPVIGYYAVVHYATGETDFEPMTIDQIHAIRNKSDAWQAFTAGKIKSTPWATDEGEMAKKTVIRRLLKRVPQSPELSDAMTIENVADNIDPQPAPRLVKAAESPRSIQATLDNFATVDAEDHSAAKNSDRDCEALDNDAEPTEDSTAIQGHGFASPAAQQESAAVMASAVVSPAVGTVPAEIAQIEAGTVSDPVATARRNGRNAALAGLPRILPDGFHYKSKRAEKNAWCQGYDEAARPAAEDFSDELHQAGAGFGV